MLIQTVRRISKELENLTKQNISIERSLDLLEASSADIEEIVVINTMRESIVEAKPIINKSDLFIHTNLSPSKMESVFLA